MGELFRARRFVWQRLIARWRLLLVAASGVVVACALLAATPIYTQAMADLGLRFRLDRALSGDRLQWLAVDGLALGSPADMLRRDAIDDIFEARLGWLYDDLLVQERSRRIPRLRFPDLTAQEAAVRAPADARPGPGSGEAPGLGAPGREQWAAFLYWLSDYEQRVTVTDGRLPGPPDAGLEVVLLDGFRRHARVGDAIEFAIGRFDDCDRVPPSAIAGERGVEVRCEPTTSAAVTVRATIVGFVRPVDPGDPRWEIFQGDLEAPERPLYAGPLSQLDDAAVGLAIAGVGSMPLLTSREQFFEAFGSANPRTLTRHRVGIFPDLSALRTGSVERGRAEPAALRRDIENELGLAAAWWFPLTDTLGEFSSSLAFSQIPVLLILLQVVGIAVYYVVIVTAALVERQAEEISVYRSRGASSVQLVGLYLMEGLVIAVPAAAAAPWLAARAVAALGLTPTFEAVSGGSALPVTITPAAYLLAAGGAVLATLAMLLPGFAVARRDIQDAKREQARPPGRSIVQRYYLDLAVAALAGFLLWQLSRRGSVFDPRSVGGWSSDPLLLLSPLLLMVAVASLFLRFYPPVLRWSVRALTAAGGTSAAVGVRRAARNPAAHMRLILLLVMAVAVGTFAASYGLTVDRSHADRVRYDTGGDLRARLPASSGPAVAEGLDAVRATAGVREAVVVRRGPVRALDGTRMRMLAVDAGRAADVVWFRDDFADESLERLMTRLRGVESVDSADGAGGIPLADEVSALRVTVDARGGRGDYFTLWARVLDGAGRYHDLDLGSPSLAGAITLEAVVPAGMTRPLAFASFVVTDISGRTIDVAGSLYLDDLAAVTTGGEAVTLDGFEGPFGWTLYGRKFSGERLERSDERATSGRYSAQWSWKVGASPGRRLLAVVDPNVPLAALVSRPAAGAMGVATGDATGIEIGDFVVPVSVRGVVDLFPTMNPDAGFAVVNLAHLTPLMRLLSVPEGEWESELWVSLEGDATRQAEVVAALTGDDAPLRLVAGSVHRQVEFSELRADPTLRSSGGGILIAAFAAVLTLATVGFVVTLALDGASRSVEFAVLRAVGLSRWQLLRSLVFEWGVVLAVGSVIGVALGRRVARVMLSFLEITESGTRVTPPFVLLTDWRTVVAGLGLLTALVALALVVSWRAAVRRPMAVELRMTQ